MPNAGSNAYRVSKLIPIDDITKNLKIYKKMKLLTILILII